MNTVYKSKDMCCGCSACESICPKKAITMYSENTGGGV